MKIYDLPLHKDTYFFGYGIDIEKPIEMANQIIKLQQENRELKKQLEAGEQDYTVIQNSEQCNPVNITEYTSAKLDTLEEILSKYKEIIGGKEC